MAEPRNNNGPFRIKNNTSNTLNIVGPFGRVTLPQEKMEVDFTSSLERFYEKFLLIFQNINNYIREVYRVATSIRGLDYDVLQGTEPDNQQHQQIKRNFQGRIRNIDIRSIQSNIYAYETEYHKTYASNCDRFGDKCNMNFVGILNSNHHSNRYSEPTSTEYKAFIYLRRLVYNSASVPEPINVRAPNPLIISSFENALDVAFNLLNLISILTTGDIQQREYSRYEQFGQYGIRPSLPAPFGSEPYRRPHQQYPLQHLLDRKGRIMESQLKLISPHFKTICNLYNEEERTQRRDVGESLQTEQGAINEFFTKTQRWETPLDRRHYDANEFKSDTELINRDIEINFGEERAYHPNATDSNRTSLFEVNVHEYDNVAIFLYEIKQQYKELVEHAFKVYHEHDIVQNECTKSVERYNQNEPNYYINQNTSRWNPLVHGSRREIFRHLLADIVYRVNYWITKLRLRKKPKIMLGQRLLEAFKTQWNMNYNGT